MGCFSSKESSGTRRESFRNMVIKGSHKEHHLDVKAGERASSVKVKANVHQLKLQYDIDRHVLGKGAFGKVYKGVDRKNPEFQVAIKVLNKSKMSANDLKHVMDEVDLLKKVDHPNIVEYFETYDDKSYIYLVMELCTGGELFDSNEDYLKSGKAYSEKRAAEVIMKCLEALQHCHALGITHRDIKPENIMFGKDEEVRLVDFGLAKDTTHHMKSYAGTPYFMAPEVLIGNYTHKCDIWSLACVLYMLIVGELPFTGSSRQEVFAKIKKAQYENHPKFSEELQSLLEQMFTINPDNRPTAQECKTHAWFKKMLDDDHLDTEQINNEVLVGLS